MRIAMCESTMRPTAYNAGSYGLMQVQYASHAALVGPDPSVLFDPETNVAIAYAIYASAGGWGPWGCRP